MGLSPDLPPTIKELISSFGNLIEEYEKEIHYFTSVVDKHVRVLEHDPFQKSLDSLLMDHEHKLDEFDKGLRENLQKIDAEIELNSKKYIDMIKNIERSKEQLATVITNISGRLSQTNIDIEDHVDMAMDFYEIIHGMAKMVLEYFGVNKAYYDLQYMRLRERENLLKSDSRLLTRFIILLGMRYKLSDDRLEKHEAFLKSKEDLFERFERLIKSYQEIIKEAGESS